MKKVYLIHCWGANSSGVNWYNWIKKELQKKKIKLIAFDMPETDNPTIEVWVKYLERMIPFEKLDEETYFIGHSVGCQAIMRYLEKLPKQKKIKGCVFVAGWFNLINLNSEEIKIAHPWINSHIDFERVIRHTKNILAIFSDDDQWVHPDEIKKFRNNLGAKIITKKKMGHFDNVDKIPEILKFIK